MAGDPDRPGLRGDRPGALPVYADGASLVLAALSVAAPPLSLVALAVCLWLLFRRRRREGEKYAGLRVLR